MSDTIEILMATYNGQQFIEEQINSLLAQTYKDWHLIIYDDGSTDGKYDILQRYVMQYSDKISIKKNTEPAGSACLNFFNMLTESRADYVMTCDQDDVWLPNKIEVTMKGMKELEKQYSHLIPLLVHTDLRVVDENLQTVSKSMFSSQHMHTDDNLNHLLIQNNVTGCTVMVNRTLLDKLLHTAEHMLMHDWWMGMIASALGKTNRIEVATMLYRQHGDNTLGAVKLYSKKSVEKALHKKKLILGTFEESCKQAKEFLENYKLELSQQQIELIEQYIRLMNERKLIRIHIFIKNKFYKKGIVRLLGQLWYL